MSDNGQNEPNKEQSAASAGHKDYLKEPWLEKYREIRTITSTCKAFGISRQTFTRWRKTDPAFEEKFIEIESELVEVLETTAYKRALEGSDVLMIFLLKASNPKYRDYIKHEIDHRFILDITSQVTAVIKRLVVDDCPNCGHHLGHIQKVAQELSSLSASGNGQ